LVILPVLLPSFFTAGLVSVLFTLSPVPEGDGEVLLMVLSEDILCVLVPPVSVAALDVLFTEVRDRSTWPFSLAVEVLDVLEDPSDILDGLADDLLSLDTAGL
jgi:hypothetical protein